MLLQLLFNYLSGSLWLGFAQLHSNINIYERKQFRNPANQTCFKTSWLCTQSRFSFKLLAVITLEMNYPSETGYPLDNSHQTDNTTLIIWKWSVLIFDEQSVRLYPSVHPSILPGFEDGYPSLVWKQPLLALKRVDLIVSFNLDLSLDCLQSSFALKIHAVLISLTVIAESDVTIIKRFNRISWKKTDCGLFWSKQTHCQPRNWAADWSILELVTDHWLVCYPG